MTYYAKLWTDIIGDEKLMRASRKGAKQLVLLPWFIAFAKKADDGGRLTVAGEPAESHDFVAAIPGATRKMVDAGLRSLERIGVLIRDQDGALRFAAWERRQWMAPSDTPEQVRERVAKHRARKRESGTDVTTSVTESVTNDVTTARGDEDEEDRDLDRDKDTPPPPLRARALRDRLTSEADRLALDTLLRRVPSPTAWAAEIDASLGGMPGHAHVSELQLGQALRDYVANGALAHPRMKHFRAYLARAAKDTPPRTAAEPTSNDVARELAEWAAGASHG